MKCDKKSSPVPPTTSDPPTTQILDQPIFSSAQEKSMSEILNAKTLVTSYREAANFLYRAASELEQLLPTNHRVF